MTVEKFMKKNSGVEEELLKLKKEAFDLNVTDKKAWSTLAEKTKAEYLKLNENFSTWVSKDIPEEYFFKIKTDVKTMKRLSKIKFSPMKKILNEEKNLKVANGLVDSATATYSNAITNGEKMILDLYKQKQKVLSSTKLTADEIEEKITKLNHEFETKFILKTEHMRHTIENYTKMFVRTELRQAQTMGTISAGTEAQTDLYQISSHNTTTEICLPYEGKVFSLKNNSEFPTLDLYPPFHPNCLHSMSPMFIETIERRGKEKYLDFAYGRSEVHPTRLGHIPASERSIE